LQQLQNALPAVLLRAPGVEEATARQYASWAGGFRRTSEPKRRRVHFEPSRAGLWPVL